MKTIVLAIVLGLSAAAVALAQTAVAPAQTAPAQTAPAAQPPKKEIKDPVEYNAYVGALQQNDPNAKVSGLEAYLQQYPNSVMKEDALDVLITAYQQTGNAAKLSDTANRLLAVNPDNAKALAFRAYFERSSQKWPEAKADAERGLQALPKVTKVEGESDADFAKRKANLAAVLNSVAGFASMQLKDNAAAAKYLRASVDANPTNVEDIYPLALAYFGTTPPDDVNGLFFIARASNLVADPKGKEQISKFGKSKYVKYHGSDEGWSDLLAQTVATTLPPADFTIKQYVPPTPAEQAAALVKGKTAEQLKALSFGEWELVLSEGAQEDADKVWAAIKDTKLVMEAQVVDATATKLMIAASQDDIDAKRADIELTMPAAIPVKQIPKVGATIDFEGYPASYDKKPFLMKMSKGALYSKEAPKAPAKPPVHRKPAAH